MQQREDEAEINLWPAYVDSLSTLLLIVVFLLTIFIVSFYAIYGEHASQMSSMLTLKQRVESLSSALSLSKRSEQALLLERNHLKTQNNALSVDYARTQTEVKALQTQLNKTQAVNNGLTQQVSSLQETLSNTDETLHAMKLKETTQTQQIATLDLKLKNALDAQIKELSEYRSNFFGELKKIIGKRTDIQIRGDRFVLQSEVLFASGEAELKPTALPELDRIIDLILTLQTNIPNSLPWILRIDGHTDIRKPTAKSRFRSNWELSAARAISVIRYMIKKGIPSSRLAATGMAEYQPIDPNKTEEAYRLNRRIEIKLTEK